MDRALFLLTLLRNAWLRAQSSAKKHGRVGVVNGNDRPDWHFPGGMIEADESPADGCEREIRKELGLA